MAEQRITIEIDKEGQITVETLGFKGDSCLEELENLLEDQISPAILKPTDDYYQQVSTKIQRKQSMERKKL